VWKDARVARMARAHKVTNKIEEHNSNTRAILNKIHHFDIMNKSYYKRKRGRVFIELPCPLLTSVTLRLRITSP